MANKPQHRSRFKRVFKALKDVTPKPVNELASIASLGSGSDVTPEYKPDTDTAPFMEPGALIDEVVPVVSGCGKIGYRAR